MGKCPSGLPHTFSSFRRQGGPASTHGERWIWNYPAWSSHPTLSETQIVKVEKKKSGNSSPFWSPSSLTPVQFTLPHHILHPTFPDPEQACSWIIDKNLPLFGHLRYLGREKSPEGQETRREELASGRLLTLPGADLLRVAVSALTSLPTWMDRGQS